MPRIGFRRILPILQRALFIAIVSVSYARDQAKKAAQEAEEAGRPSGWIMMDHSPPPLDVDLVMSLNAPAVVAGVVLGGLVAGVLGLEEQHFSWLPGGSDTAWLFPIALFLVLQWYLVGRWYDRRVGLAPQPMPRPPGRLRRFVGWAGLILAGVFGFLCLGRSFFSHIDSCFEISLAVWFFIAAVAQLQKIRRWRGDLSALTSLRLS